MTANTGPVFIVGAPRSGTTLLQVLMDQHPDIAIPPESHIFERFVPVLPMYGDLRSRSNLLHLARDIALDRRIRTWHMRISAGELARDPAPRSFGGLVRRLFSKYARLRGKRGWGDKTPEHTLFLEAIQSHLPDASIIHIVRDGRDVAESLLRMYMGPNTIDDAARTWKRFILAFEAFRESNPRSRIFTLKYEELVVNPADALAALFRFLGLAVASPGSSTSDLAREYVARLGPHHLRLLAPVSPSRVGIHREALTRREIEIFEHFAGDDLRQQGYPLLCATPSGPTAAETARLQAVAAMRRVSSKVFHPRYMLDRAEHALRRLRFRLYSGS